MNTTDREKSQEKITCMADLIQSFPPEIRDRWWEVDDRNRLVRMSGHLEITENDLGDSYE